jgi:hypothetical protein
MSLSQPHLEQRRSGPEAATTLQTVPRRLPGWGPHREPEHKQNWRQRMSEPVPLREAMQAFWAQRNAMIIAADPEPDPEPEPEPEPEAGA